MTNMFINLSAVIYVYILMCKALPPALLKEHAWYTPRQEATPRVTPHATPHLHVTRPKIPATPHATPHLHVTNPKIPAAPPATPWAKPEQTTPPLVPPPEGGQFLSAEGATNIYYISNKLHTI